MTRLNEPLLSLVTDEQKYIKLVEKFNDSKVDEVPIIDIPRKSFTARRLIYGSATELSLCSKVILLGGIPKQWCEGHRNHKWRGMTTRRTEREAVKLTSYGYNSAYQRKATARARSKVSRFYMGKCDLEVHLDALDQKQTAANNSLSPVSMIPPSTKGKEKKYNRYRRKTDGDIPINVQSVDKFYGVPLSTVNELRDTSSINRINNFDRIGKPVETVPVQSNNLVTSTVKTNLHDSGPDKNLLDSDIICLNEDYLENEPSKRVKEEESSPVTKVDTIRFDAVSRGIYQAHTSCNSFEYLQNLEARPVGKSKFTAIDQPEKKLRYDFNLYNNQEWKNLHPNESTAEPRVFGEIIMMERMLVMVKEAVKHKAPISNFSEIESIDTRIEDRWKEYMVVARTLNPTNNSILIQFYRRRTVPKNILDDISTEVMRGSSLDFEFDAKSYVSFYSSLDKSICIQHPRYHSKSLTAGDSEYLYFSGPLKFYILQFKSMKSSFKWYSFLKSTLGVEIIPKQLPLRVPEIDISLNIPISAGKLSVLQNIELGECDVLKIAILTRGYRVFPSPIQRLFMSVIYHHLVNSKLHHHLMYWVNKRKNNLSCTLKRYDRLEWCADEQASIIYPMSLLHNTHTLEFRTLAAYPRYCLSTDGRRINEPIAIEGFLIRCFNGIASNYKFAKRSQITPLYFFTSDHLLFYTSSTNSIPPLPFGIRMDEIEGPEISAKLGNVLLKLPNIYEQDPYPLDLNGHIEWLTESDTESFDKRDLYAFECYNRRIKQILKAEGIIDMLNIEEIIYTEKSEESNDKKYRYIRAACTKFWEYREPIDICNSAFQIKMKNGTIIRLVAFNSQTAKEWITRLCELVRYWKLRKLHDVLEMKRVKEKNLTALKISEIEESNIGENTSKWICDGGIPDVTLFNVNGLSSLRPLLKEGILYQKPRKHSTLSKYFVVLIPGFITLYRCIRRHTPSASFGYTHYATIPLAECYLYSGPTAESDMLNRDHCFDVVNPGSHSLPRVYEDSWKSTEDELSRVFVLWFGTRRTLRDGHNQFNNEEQYIYQTVLNGEHHIGSFDRPEGKLKFVKKLGVKGQSMVFMARSRQERDAWVLSLYEELERLNCSTA